MTVLRSLLYAALFYGGTALWVLAGVLISPFGRRPTLAVVLSWADLNHWLARHVLGIRTRVDGVIPNGPYLIAVKHEASLETTEMLRLTKLPVIVIKRELADIPGFGFLTKQYGVIPVERTAGAKALRAISFAVGDQDRYGRGRMPNPPLRTGRRRLATGQTWRVWPPVCRSSAASSGGRRCANR